MEWLQVDITMARNFQNKLIFWALVAKQTNSKKEDQYWRDLYIIYSLRRILEFQVLTGVLTDEVINNTLKRLREYYHILSLPDAEFITLRGKDYLDCISGEVTYPPSTDTESDSRGEFVDHVCVIISEEETTEGGETTTILEATTIPEEETTTEEETTEGETPPIEVWAAFIEHVCALESESTVLGFIYTKSDVGGILIGIVEIEGDSDGVTNTTGIISAIASLAGVTTEVTTVTGTMGGILCEVNYTIELIDLDPNHIWGEINTDSEVIGEISNYILKGIINTNSSLGGNIEIPSEDICFGYLYNWYAVDDVRNIASIGSHVATIAEMAGLQALLGGVSVAGGELKEIGEEYWISNTGATNSVKFNGRGSGIRPGVFNQLKNLLWVWASDSDTKGSVGICYSTTTVFNIFYNSYSKYNGMAVRLVKDSTTLSHGETGTYTGNDGKVYRTICIGTQELLADNLAETKYRDDSWIPGFDGGTYTPISSVVWEALTTGAMCVYDDDLNNV